MKRRRDYVLFVCVCVVVVQFQFLDYTFNFNKKNRFHIAGPTSVDSLMSSTPPHSFVPLSVGWSRRIQVKGSLVSLLSIYFFFYLTLVTFPQSLDRAGVAAFLLSKTNTATPPPFTLSCEKGRRVSAQMAKPIVESDPHRFSPIRRPTIISNRRNRHLFIAHLPLRLYRVCKREGIESPYVVYEQHLTISILFWNESKRKRGIALYYYYYY